MTRTDEEWTKIIGEMAGQPLEDIAARILGDLTHYHHGGSYESDDRKELGAALLAFSTVFADDRHRR